MSQMTLLQGTLDLLILRVLALGPLHGVGIADRISQVTRGTFDVKAGSLFPALHRLEAEGWVAGEWGQSPAGRRAKLYTLTEIGRISSLRMRGYAECCVEMPSIAISIESCRTGSRNWQAATRRKVRRHRKRAGGRSPKPAD